MPEQVTEQPGNNAEDRRCAPLTGLLVETSVSRSNMPTACAERANSTHITLVDWNWRNDTVSNSQRTQELYKWHHNFPQSRAEGRCSYCVSTKTKSFIKQVFGRDRIYTGRFSYLPARDKRCSPSWLYHSTLSPLPEDSRQQTREFAWFLHESAAPHFRTFVRKMLVNNSLPANCVACKITGLNTISAFNLWSIVFPVAFNYLEGL